MAPQTDSLARGTGMDEDARIDQIVEQNHVGAFQALHSPQRNQAGVSRSRANQIDLSESS